jgi:hypothetical protein
MRADVSTKMQYIQARLDRKRDQLDVKTAETDAEWAEDEAADAVDSRRGRSNRRKWPCWTRWTPGLGPTPGRRQDRRASSLAARRVGGDMDAAGVVLNPRECADVPTHV